MNDSSDLRLSLSVARVGKLSDRASRFHDSCLGGSFLTEREVLSFEVCNIWWKRPNSCSKLDRVTRICFRLGGAMPSDCFGTDEEICQSAIYDFVLEGGFFKILTGDGLRSGRFESRISTVQIITTKELIAEHNLPL
jgi:hypothetical protein